ncbi:unnamed protein product, partial [Bubo scandiacus]
IDECSDGFVQCDSRANCINLPGWYHCECRDGYHDNGMFSPSGESCEDIDECGTGRHSCTNDTVCFNLDGGYDCRCPHGKNCTGDCIHENKIKHNGQIWVLENDRCSVCSCQSGYVMCRRMVCDCENPTVDLFCCPECDPRLSSQCLHQSGELSYSSGDSWIQNCQQCRCLQGEVDCWPLPCPEVDCEFSILPENECCPRCVTDPCQADTVRNDITKTCLDETNVVRFTGSSWIKHGTECTLCQCKVNFLIFIRVICIIISKLQANLMCKTDIKCRLAKSTLTLIPLLGTHEVIFAFITDEHAKGMLRFVKLFTELSFASFQGLMVAILYCFINNEVQMEFRKSWERWRLEHLYVQRDSSMKPLKCPANSISSGGTVGSSVYAATCQATFS